MRTLKIAIFSLLALLVIAAIVLQSELGKGIVQRFLTRALHESGYKVEIGSFEGTIPHAIELKNVKIESDTLEVTVDSLKTRLSMWALLRKELLFTEIQANGISWKTEEGAPVVPFKKGKGLFFSLRVKHFTLTHVHFLENFQVNVEGSCRVGEKNRDIFLSLLATRPSFSDSTLHITSYLDENRSLRLKGSLRSPTLKVLPFPVPFDARVDMRFALRQFGENHIAGNVSGTFSPHSLGLGAIDPWIETDWRLKAHVGMDAQGLQISRLIFTNDLFQGNGQAKFDRAARFENGSFLLQSRQPQLTAHLHLTAAQEGIALKGDMSLPKLDAHSFLLEKVYANAEALWQTSGLKGSAVGKGTIYGEEIKGKTDFSWKPGSSLFLNDALLNGASLQALGNIEIRPNMILIGQTEVALQNPLPFGLYGTLQAKADWLVSEGKQAVTCEATSMEVYWKDLFFEKISVDFSLLDPFKLPQGRVLLRGEGVQWHKLWLDQLYFETLVGTFHNPFVLDVSGKWIHPLELGLNGTWQYESSHLSCSLLEASGFFYNHPLALTQAVFFESKPGLFRLNDLDLQLADGRLFLAIEELENEGNAQLVLERFPLDLLSLNPFDIAISGRTDCTISLYEKKGEIGGTLKAAVQQLEIVSPGETPPISTSGTFSGSFGKGHLVLQGALVAQDVPFISLDLLLPLHLELHPLRASFVYNEQAKGHLALNGRVEKILDFFDFGMHRIEGKIAGELQLEGTLADPQIQGMLHFENGYYENYFTGTRLLDIEAKGKAQGDIFTLTTFTANDGKGKLSATGKISLLPAESFPYHFDLSLSRFQITQIDLVSAEIDGALQIIGTSKGAIATGQVEVIESTLHVPHYIPRSLPNIVVVYRNGTTPTEQPKLPPPKPPFPLQLDLAVTAPEGIFIEGRGLDSEWKGNFHVGGVYTSVAAQGTLELIKGEFLFSGRHFKLLHGSLSFTGLEHEMPSLNLTAQIDIKDISITAHVRGPLNYPQLILQSTPPLPLSTIVSYLLFGQEIAEINSFQALQLANSLAALIGQGPEALESTRKALGIDRLNIISKGEKGEVEETIALQVGKYVSEGVLVSFTQGAEESSTDISIEIELQGGWAIQLENDQRQEQGKFTVKWNHYY